VALVHGGLAVDDVDLDGLALAELGVAQHQAMVADRQGQGDGRLATVLAVDRHVGPWLDPDDDRTAGAGRGAGRVVVAALRLRVRGSAGGRRSRRR
jgi:hypothetical protein